MGVNAELGGKANCPHATPIRTRPTASTSKHDQLLDGKFLLMARGRQNTAFLGHSLADNPSWGWGVSARPVRGDEDPLVSSQHRSSTESRDPELLLDEPLSSEMFTEELKLNPPKNRPALFSLTKLSTVLFSHRSFPRPRLPSPSCHYLPQTCSYSQIKCLNTHRGANSSKGKTLGPGTGRRRTDQHSRTPPLNKSSRAGSWRGGFTTVCETNRRFGAQARDMLIRSIAPL